MAYKKLKDFKDKAKEQVDKQLSDLATANEAQLNTAKTSRDSANKELDTNYGNLIDQIIAKYAQTKGNYENQMVAKGMFRSSVNVSGLAGLDNESGKAQTQTTNELNQKKSANDASVTTLANNLAAAYSNQKANRSSAIASLADTLYNGYLDTVMKKQQIKQNDKSLSGGGSGGGSRTSSSSASDSNPVLSQGFVPSVGNGYKPGGTSRGTSGGSSTGSGMFGNIAPPKYKATPVKPGERGARQVGKGAFVSISKPRTGRR